MEVIAQSLGNDPLLITGDFNLVMQKYLDSINRRIPLFKECIEARAMLEDHLNVTDIFRLKNPTKVEFSYSPQGPNARGIFSRIDHMLANLDLADDIQSLEYIEMKNEGT